jgi:2-phosphosulfolactate phosphatase
VAEHLRGRDRPTYLVACGSGGQPTTDDLLGAVVVDRYLRGNPPSAAEREHFATMLVTSKGPGYADGHETRRRDLHEFATAIDRRDVVPALRGDRLVDAARER